MCRTVQASCLSPIPKWGRAVGCCAASFALHIVRLNDPKSPEGANASLYTGTDRNGDGEYSPSKNQTTFRAKSSIGLGLCSMKGHCGGW